MATGLNASQRDIVRAMVQRGESGEYVRDQIDKMSSREGWDYNKNAQFVAELATVHGYYETAKHLEQKINA